MEQKLCQSCGMNLKDESLLGLEVNGLKNREYCKFCFMDGKFIKPEETINQMINSCVPFIVKEGFSVDIATNKLEKLLPQLKRWKEQL